MKQKRTATTISSLEFFKLFGDEDTARKYIETLVWGDTPHCRHCGSDKVSERVKRKGYRCKDCRKDFTVKTGIIFEKSKATFTQWLYAIYLMQMSRKGISSLQLSKEIGCTQTTAWFINQRIREICKQGTYKLQHIVGIDETFIGGKEGNKHSSKRLHNKAGYSGKIPVMGMKQRNGSVRAVAKTITKKNILQFIKDNLQEWAGTTVFTDNAGHYKHIEGFDWEKIDHAKGEYVRGEVHTNSIESVWAVLKRGIGGIYHHVSSKHLQRYINEFTFRLNEGNCEVDTIDRINAVVKNCEGIRLRHKDLVK